MAMGDGTHKLPVKTDVREAIEKEEGDAVVVRLKERLARAIGTAELRLKASMLSTGIGSTLRAVASSIEQVAEHHRVQEPLGPRLALGLEPDHCGGVGLDRLGRELEAALPRMLVAVLEEDRSEVALGPGPALELVVIGLREHEANAGSFAFSFSCVFQR